MAAGRGRKWGIVLIVLVVVLGGLFVLGDRIAAYAAERTIASQAKQELAARDIQSSGDPKVSIGGFPFLTQVARGRYDKITIDVDKPSSQGVTLDQLHVVATGVNAKTSALINGTGQVTADVVTGAGRMNWDSVTKLMDLSGLGASGATASPLPGGQVRVTLPVTIGSTSTTVIADGTVQLSGGEVQLKINNVSTQGGGLTALEATLLNSIKRQLSITFRVPALPYHLVLRTVQTATDGITVTAVAQNVPIAGAGSR